MGKRVGRGVSPSLLEPCPGSPSGDAKVSKESWRVQLEAGRSVQK